MEDNVQSILQKEKQNKQHFPQLFIAAANAFSVVYASVFGAIATLLAIVALINIVSDSGFLVLSGIDTYTTLWYSVSAIIFGVIAFLSMKKLTDASLLKKTYSIAAAFLVVILVMLVAMTISAVLYALLGAGVGATFQKLTWKSLFLPAFIISLVFAGLLFVVKKVSDGNIKMLPIVINSVLGISALGFLLTAISTLILFYN